MYWASYQTNLGEEALLDLSHTLFFSGFRVWKKRQKLAHIFWNQVKQRQQKAMPKRKKRRRKQLEEIDESKCQNPFHYLRRHSNHQINVQQNVPVEIALKKKSISISALLLSYHIVRILFIKQIFRSLPLKQRDRKYSSVLVQMLFVKNMTVEKNVRLNNSH